MYFLVDISDLLFEIVSSNFLIDSKTVTLSLDNFLIESNASFDVKWVFTWTTEKLPGNNSTGSGTIPTVAGGIKSSLSDLIKFFHGNRD